MTITAHCLVKNEENFIWYALSSVLPFVDKVLVWDTGSTDKTVDIIKSINSPKIEFAERGPVDIARHTELRNEMIASTATDWFMILDGDEVWPEGQLRHTINNLKGLSPEKSCILSKNFLCAGDIFHHSTWGQYHYNWGLIGFYFPRFLRRINGIHWVGDYDHDALVYEDGGKVVTEEHSVVSDNYFWHCGILPRSSKDNDINLGHGRRPVNTYALGFLRHGKKLPPGVEFPVVFSQPALKDVTSPRRLSLLDSWKNLFSSYLPWRIKKWLS
ncbi:MAG: glycosyltransferase [candidate division WWE3 bacterium]|nr:glycosyltransferase [candidate division WWE3 bacterium]